MNFKTLRRAVNAGTHKNFSKTDTYHAHEAIRRVESDIAVRKASLQKQLCGSRRYMRSGRVNQWDPNYHGEHGNMKGRTWATRLVRGKFPAMCAELDRDMDVLDTVKRAMGLATDSKPFPSPAPQPERIVI